MLGRETARAILFFGTGGGVPSEKNLTWWRGRSEKCSEDDHPVTVNTKHCASKSNIHSTVMLPKDHQQLVFNVNDMDYVECESLLSGVTSSISVLKKKRN